MTGEIRVVRLPAPLSNIVDEAVGRFIESHSNERLEAHRRYHGADLWMVYAHEPVGGSEPAFLTRRITIGVYSDEPDRLRFIPDIVVTRPTGRFTIEYVPGQNGMYGQIPPISTLHVRLALDAEQVSQQLLDKKHPTSVSAALEQAWRSAREIDPPSATQLIL